MSGNKKKQSEITQTPIFEIHLDDFNKKGYLLFKKVARSTCFFDLISICQTLLLKVLLKNEKNSSKNLVPKEYVSSHSHMNETKTFKHEKVFKYVGLLLNLMAVPYFYNSHFVSPD